MRPGEILLGEGPIEFNVGRPTVEIEVENTSDHVIFVSSQFFNDALDENRLVYEVDPGPRGDHVHIYVDNKEVGILRKLKGSFLLEAPSPGKHGLCVKVVNKAHVPVGIEQCIQVTVK